MCENRFNYEMNFKELFNFFFNWEEIDKLIRDKNCNR